MAAIELGIPYYFYTPSQATYCAVNAPTDPNFVGYISDITGLDSPGIRENAQIVTAGDGGYHGRFWKDRRPWTMSGTIVPQFPLTARDSAQELLEGILLTAMSADGYLKWTPADGVIRRLLYRAQQPPRITKGQSNIDRTFQIACVTADWRVTSWNLQSLSATGASPLTVANVQNLGNAPAAPIFTITGPVTNAGNLTITNAATGKAVVLNTPTITAGTTWTIDLSGTYPTVVDSGGTNHDGLVDPLLTDWETAVEGTLIVANGLQNFTMTASGTSAATALQIQWRHSWV